MSDARAQDASSEDWRIEVKLVMNPEHMAMVMAVMAAVFLGEEDHITYFDEFDGNDFVATHFLALVDGDPAGVIRLRWFNGFAMLERVGIRKRYRSYKVFAALARVSLDHARQKGYRLVTGRARGDTIKLWRRFNGRASGPEIHMYRGTLVPTLFEFPPRPDGQIGVGPFGDPAYEDQITQIEGDWTFPSSNGARSEAAE